MKLMKMVILLGMIELRTVERCSSVSVKLFNVVVVFQFSLITLKYIF